jgi:phosphohistidine phosphatase
MLVGHEPTCSASVGLLSGQGNVRFPTAAMARIDFDVDSWERIQAEGGRLIWMLPPKVLKGVATD